MAGSVFVNQRIWSTSGSIFYWLLEHVRDRLNRADEESILDEVIDNNIGILDLDAVPAPEREAILSVMLNLLKSDMSQMLSSTAPNYDAVVRSLDELREIIEAGGPA